MWPVDQLKTVISNELAIQIQNETCVIGEKLFTKTKQDASDLRVGGTGVGTRTGGFQVVVSTGGMETGKLKS